MIEKQAKHTFYKKREDGFGVHLEQQRQESLYILILDIISRNY